MSDSVVNTNIPIMRAAYGSQLPPKVPYADTDDVGSENQPVFLQARKLVPSELNCGSEDEGVYFEGGIVKKCKKQSTTSITPLLQTGVPIASVEKDNEATKFIFAPSPGNPSDEEIRTLKVPLLTPMWFDYNVEDDRTWLRATEGASYYGMLTNSNAIQATGSRDTSKTYWVQDNTTSECRIATEDDFENDGSFKSSVVYWTLNAGTKIFNYAYKHLVNETAIAGVTAASETYTMSNNTSVVVNFLKTLDNHKIILIGNTNCKVTVGGSVKTTFNDIKTALTNLVNDVEIGIAWYFIVDPAQKVFVLPRARYGFTGGLGYVKTAQASEQTMFLYFHAGVAFDSGEDQEEDDNVFDKIYPPGSIYITINKNFDPNVSFKGVWYVVGKGRCLLGVDPTDQDDVDSNLGKNLEAGLPNITGTFGHDIRKVTANESGEVGEDSRKYAGLVWRPRGCFKRSNSTAMGYTEDRRVFVSNATLNPGIEDVITFNASRSSEIYGRSSTVQPPSLGVIFWQRIA